ncbi:MAG: hypothetical protein IKV67_06200, partial [Paludibacteraceae bacterium]|nr:hypothetical protein [Paludibacteraceae bacterium]
EYRVKVTSAQNCTKTTDAIAVEFHSLPTPQIVKVDANDYLCADGKALTLKTSDEYESYKWSTTATTAIIDVTTAGDYTVEVTDDNNCKATSEKFSVALHSLPVLDEIADQTVCVDAKANFTLTLATATEGEYTYNVSTVNPQTSDAFSLGKGNYSATVTDKYGCTSEAKSFKVEEYAWTAATLASSSQTICKENLSDLSAITVNATTNGAAGSLTYTWILPAADNSTSSTGNTHTPAVEEVGTYTYNVIVNDACTKGKTDNLTYTLTINAAPTISDLTAPSAVCEGSSFILPIVSSVANGSVITSEGWKYNDGGVWKDFVNNNLQPGSYTLKYAVTNGCGTAERELGQTVEVSAASAIAVTPQTAKICKDIQPVLNVTSITGNITKITANGVALDQTDYAYDITGKKITLPAISEKTTYVVTVKNGACDEKDASATVDIYSAPVIGDVTLPAVCVGATNVELPTPDLTWNDANAGSPAREQGWYNGDDAVTSDYIKNLTANTYTFTYKVKNECGLTESKNFEFVVNANPTVELAASDACGDVTFTATAKVGETVVTENIQYLWSETETGVYAENTAKNNIQTLTAVRPYTELSKTWYVKVKNSLTECESKSPDSKSATSYLASYAEFSPENVTVCPGNDAVVTVSNVAGIVTAYIWKGDDVANKTLATITDGKITQKISDESDIYHISATVTNGVCAESSEIKASMSASGRPTLEVEESSSLCVDGTTVKQNSVLTATENAGYRYSWYKEGAKETCLGTSNTLTVSSAGKYFVDVVMGSNCTNEASIEVSEKNIPNVTLDYTKVCIGATAYLSATSTTSAEYKWDSEVAYGTTNTLSVTEAGSHTVYVKDANGCTNQASLSVDFNSLPVVSLSADDACETTTFTPTPADNTKYDYNWNDSGYGSETSKTLSISAGKVSESATWTVVIKDKTTGCESTSATATATVYGTPALSLAPVTICKGETANISYSGLVGTITSYGGLTANGNILEASPATTSTYTLKVENGQCTNIEPTVTVTVNDKPTITISAPNPVCEGVAFTLSDPVIVNNGSDIVGTGKWQIKVKGAGEWIDFDVMSAPVAGTHKLQYVATNGCGENYSNEVNAVVYANPSTPSLTAGTVCGGDVTFTASGANTGETYLWSNTADGTFVAGESTKTLTYNANGDKIQSATWYVKVKNANGCESETANATGKAYIPPVANIISELGQCSYTLSANLTGNAYSYAWSRTKIGSESTIVANEAGTYDLVITEKYSDNHECPSSVVSETITISGVTLPTISYTKTCVGQDATLNLTNTVDGYSYEWKQKDGTSTEFVTAGTGTTISVAEAGDYKVIATTAQNCIDSTDAMTVEFHSLPTPQIVKADANDYLCADGNALTLKTSEEYKSYEWSTAATTATIDATTAGDYTVEVMDDNNCKATSEKFSVELHPLPVLDDIVDQTVCVDAKANFTLTLATATEGEYTYNVSTVNPQTSDEFLLGKGNYSATVTDKYGCTSEAKTFKVEEYSAPVIGDVTLSAVCVGTTDVELPTPGLTWNDADAGSPAREQGWYNGDVAVTSDYIKDLTANTYTFTYKVKNECGLTESKNFEFVVNAKPVIPNIADVTLCYGETKEITANITANTYSWKKAGETYGDNSASMTTADEHGVVEYSLTVTDANNCTSEPETFTVTQPASELTVVKSEISPSVYGLSDGSYSITINGGYGDYKYCEKTSETAYCTPDAVVPVTGEGSKISVSDVAAGNYYYTIKDKHGCEIPVTVTVPSPDVPNVNWNITDALCNGVNTNDPAKLGGVKATSPSGAFTIKMIEPASGYSDVVSSEVGGEHVAEFTGLTTGTYKVLYVLNANPDIKQEKTFEITEPDQLLISMDYATGTSCAKNYNKVNISNVSGGTQVDNLDPSKLYFDDKYEVSYSDNETVVSYADGIFTLADGISTAKLTAALTDKNGCVATQTVEYRPASSDLNITCGNLKGIVAPLDDNCEKTISLSEIEMKDSVDALLCSPNSNVKVEYSIDNGSSYNNTPFAYTLTNNERQKTIMWKFSTDYAEIDPVVCEQTIKAVDDKSPVFASNNIDETIKYSDQTKTCGANYTNDDVESLLGIEDCSLREVSYCLRELGKTDCISTGKVFENGSYKPIATEDLSHGQYEIVYTATDGTNESVDKVQKITIVDDVAPTIECLADYEIDVNPADGCKATEIAAIDSIYEQYVVKNNIATKNADGTFSVVDPNRITLSGDSKTIESIKDECGVTLKVESSLDNTSFDETDKPFTLGVGESQTINWTMSDGISNTSCSTVVTAVDNSGLDLSGATLADVKEKYSDNIDKCSASYKWTVGEIQTWLDKIKDCSGIKDVNYVVKDKSGNQITSGSIVSDESVSEMDLTNLSHGDYVIEYEVIDHKGDKATINQNLSVSDDIAPEITCYNDKEIQVPVGDDCNATVDLDIERLLYASRADNMLGSAAVDNNGVEIDYESSDDIEKSIFKTNYDFRDEQKNAMSNDCGEPLSTKFVVSTKNDAGVFVPDGDTIDNNESITIKYKEEKQVTIIVADASGNPTECTYTLVGAPQIINSSALADETGLVTGKDASGKEKCSVEYTKTFAEVYKEIYGKEYVECSPVTELQYEIKKSTGEKVTGSVKPDGSTSFSEDLVPGDYTITWNAVDLNNTSEVVDNHKIEVADNVAPEITCADVEVPMDANCEASIDMDMHQFALGYLADKIMVDKTTGEISAKNPGDEVYFKLSADKKTITNIYDGCNTDLSIKVSETDGVGSEDHLNVSLDNDHLTKDVYWTLSDGTNNSTQCKSTVSAVDTMRPVVSIPDAITVHTNSSADKCIGDTSIANDDIKTALNIKDCSSYTVTYSVDGNTSEPLTTNNVIANGLTIGEHEITYVVEDATGRKTTVSQKVTVVDNVAPTIECLADYDIYVQPNNDCKVIETAAKDSIYEQYVIANNIATKNADGTFSVVDPNRISLSGDSKTIESIKDECGVTLKVESSLDNTSFDETDKQFTLGVGESQTINWTMSDGYNMSSCSTVVTAKDTTRPEIVTPDAITVHTSSSTDKCAGDTTITNSSIKTALDIKECSDYTITYAVDGGTDITLSSGDVVISDLTPGEHEIKYTVTDVTGKTSTATQKVNVVDNVAPTIECLADFDVYVQPNNGCKSDSTVTVQMLKDAYVKANEASATEITTATNENNIPYAYTKDGDGNVDKVYDECGKELSFFVGLTKEEEKSSVDVSVSLDDNDTYVYWTLKDVYDNASRCSTLVAPKDSTKPEIAQSLDVLKLDGTDGDSKCQGVSDLSYNTISNMLNISDCSETEISYVIVHEDGTTTSAKKVENDAFYKFKETLNDGDVIEWIVTDKFQNADSVQQNVEIIDKIAPKINCAELVKNITISENELAAGICIEDDYLINHKGLFTGLKSTDNRWVKDNCTDFDDIVVTSNRSDGKNNGDQADLSAHFMVGSTTVNWIFTDKAGNSDFCPQIVNIINNPPAIVCEPSEVKIQVTRTNNCDKSYKIDPDKVIADLRRGVLIEKGIIDADGNILNGMSDSEIDDLLRKSDCKHDLMLDYKSDVSIDNDGSFTFEIGKDVVVSYRVYDEYGNESFCTVTYKPVDEEKPYVSKNEFTSTVERGVNCQYTYSNTKSDFLNRLDAADCSSMKVYYEIDGEKAELENKMTYPDFDSEIGNETIKWTIEDAFGNFTEVVETVNKVDHIAPSVACPIDPIKLPMDDDCHARISMTNEQVIAMMRAGAVLPAINDDSLKKVMGVDLYGMINDAEKETVTHDCGETVHLLVKDGESYVEKDEVVVDVQYGETVTMEFAVRDSSGNENTCSLTFVAADTTAPKITSQDTVKLYYEESECKCTYSKTREEIERMLNIIDCDKNTTISYTLDGVTRPVPMDGKFEFSLLDGDIKNITWTVTDESGNSSSENLTIVAYDTIAPKFDCSTLPKDLVVVLHNHGDEATFEKFEEVGLDTSIIFEDRCSETLKPSFIREDGKNVFKDIYPANDTTILYTTFTDKASNSQTCEQKLVVKDLIKPTIICPNDHETPFACVDDPKFPYVAKNIAEFKTYLYGEVLDAQNVDPNKPMTSHDDFEGDNCESITTRTYTIYDIFGGSSSCSYKIHVKDNVPPVWTEKLNVDTLYMACDQPSTGWNIPKAEDYCNDRSTHVLFVSSSTQVMDQTQCGFYNYDKTFKYYAIDGCGNVTPDSLTLVLVVRDNNKPKFDVPDWFADSDVSANSDGNCVMLMPDLKPFTSNWDDPCQSERALTFTQSPAAGTVLADNVLAQMVLKDACGNEFVYEKKISVPKREDIVTATANDFVKCEGTELDVNLMSDTIISAAGKSIVKQEDNSYKEEESKIVFDVYRGSIAVPNLVYSNNKKTFGLRFSSDPEKVAQYTAIDKLTQTGTYYYVAQDLNTGCMDTVSAYVGIRQRPRVAMSSVDTVEACEYQALAVNGMAGDYKDILNVCVENMGSEIIEEGWMIG